MRCKFVSSMVLHVGARELYKVSVVLATVAGGGCGVLFSSAAYAHNPYIGYETPVASNCINSGVLFENCARWDNSNYRGVRGAHFSQMAGRYFSYLTSGNGADTYLWSGVWAGSKSAGLFYGDDPFRANRIVVDAEGTTIAGNRLVLSSRAGISVSGSRVSNVKNGGSAGDAVNVNQLSRVANVLGVKIDTNGYVTTPTYRVGGKSFDNIADAIAAAADSGTDPNAVVYDDFAKRSITLDMKGTTLKNVAAGTVSATSMEAINGSQLHRASQNVATALGGGSTVDTAGNLTAPKYRVGDKTYGNVGDAIAAAADSGGGMDPNAVAYDDAAGSTITLRGEHGTALKNVAAGSADTDAVNVGQLTAATQPIRDELADVSLAMKSIQIKPQGVDAIAAGTNAVAVGAGANAMANGSIALGAGSRVTGLNSVAIGINSVALETNQVSVGDVGRERRISNLAAGTKGTDAVNLNQLSDAIGKVSSRTDKLSFDLDSRRSLLIADPFAMDEQRVSNFVLIDGQGADGSLPNAASIADGDPASTTSAAIGIGSVASGADTIAIGMRTIANSDNSVAIGNMAQTGSEQPYSVAIGSHVTTNGASALAIGSQARANGENAIAVGNNNVHAIGESSIAIGNGAEAVVGATNGIALGTGASVARNVTDAMALGAKAFVEKRANGAVALGAGSQASRANTISVGNAGSERQIVNVAAGTQGTDAVNVAQLQGAAASLASVIGGDTTVDGSGHVAIHSIEVSGHKYATVSAAVQAAAAYGATDSLAVRYDLDSHGNPNYGSVTLGGPSAAPVMLTNVADGKSRYDAVNYGQLSSLQSDFENRMGAMDDRVSKIETDTGDSRDDSRVMTMANLRRDNNDIGTGSGSVINSDAGDTTAIGANSTQQASSGTAIGAGADARAINSTAIGQAASAHGENSTAVGQGATAWGNNSIAIGAGSVADADNAVSFGNSATGMTRTLTNVSAGVAPTDAVNVQQLDESVGGLRSQIEHDRADANGGTASAVAIASLPQAPAPGKSVVAVGGGTYAGQSALAVGLSTYAGRWIIKASGSTNTRGTVAGGVGAGFVW
ncbi:MULTISPECIES: YadA family autotransporter adhesin [Burkholderia cepacia complex]|uniref:YadA domain protein n=1 Tax=Burkholderia orbicola (strain MC0-3) TaxID=406425 RepID=B1K3F5_BURO0|nr:MULTISPECIES: YadA-like family protein [Burkholderia cepacia complex]ACA93834.1 YadA domain protein [Burkholderia orbicola MC0-3]MCA8085828.1 YadA-like family protein [Burkholderia cenocepacia]